MNSSMAQKPDVSLFTDGACIGNPGPGGWAFILKHPDSGTFREGSGGMVDTTNNRMEITAVIFGLESLKQSSLVKIYSDSEYLVLAIEERLNRWKAAGWRRGKRSKGTVKNLDLWKRLYDLLQKHEVHAQWVKAHAGHPENERCDHLALAEAVKFKSKVRSSDDATSEEPDLFT